MRLAPGAKFISSSVRAVKREPTAHRSNALLKQKLLETLNVHRRLELFGAQLRTEIEALKLRRKLQGGLPDERISEN